MSEISYDLVIIGAGPGGYVAAIRASQLGLKTALIEKDKPGGVCLNVGCIPSKALLHQAELFRSVSALRNMGLIIDTSAFDYAKVWQKSRDVASRLSRGVQGLLKKNKVEYVAGSGSILGPGRVQVITQDSPAPLELKTKNILIATGSRPKAIPGYEFDGETVLSSTDLLLLNCLPASLVILGAGAIGVEFACIMASFGVQVTLVEMAARILPQMDGDAVSVVAAELRHEGVKILTGCRTGALEYTDDGISLECTLPDGTKQLIEAQKILIATGRSPNTEKLGLETLGISTIAGCIPVGDFYQTAVDGIYAIGDVINTPQLAHLASKEGEIVVEHIAGHPVSTQVDPNSVPFAVYASPELASFGLTEDQAKKSGIAAKTFSFPFLGVGKAIASDQPLGFVKIVADGSNILGAHIVGPSATDLIHELLLAREAGLAPIDVAKLIHAHPTFSEGIMEAARGIDGWAIHI